MLHAGLADETKVRESIILYKSSATAIYTQISLQSINFNETS